MFHIGLLCVFFWVASNSDYGD